MYERGCHLRQHDSSWGLGAYIQHPGQASAVNLDGSHPVRLP